MSNFKIISQLGKTARFQVPLALTLASYLLWGCGEIRPVSPAISPTPALASGERPTPTLEIRPTTMITPGKVSPASTVTGGVVTPQEEPVVSLEGWFIAVWSGAGPGSTRYFLAEDNGQTTELLLDDKLLQSLGGLMALNRKRVLITGERQFSSSATVRLVRVIHLELKV